jgi:CBS domain-containing protein
MNAEDIMTRTVITATPETTIAEAARLMLQHQISGLPVVDSSGAVVGVVTEGDLLRRIETGTERRRSRWLELLLGPGRLASDYVAAHARKVGEVMSRDVASAAPLDPLSDIVRLMERRRVKRLPVIAGDRLVGIVSRANLVRALVGILATPPSPAVGGDDAIRDRIMAEIARQPWGPRAGIEVTVKDGVVELWGTIIDERERAALSVVAENVPGVRAVRDHIVWVEPVSGLVIPAVGSEPGDAA